MPHCKNNKNKKYTGKENTPLGKGFHASAYKDGKRMKGKDGNFYQVKGNRWQRIKKERNKRGFGGDWNVTFQQNYNSMLAQQERDDLEYSQDSKSETENFLKDARSKSPDSCDFLANNIGNPGGAIEDYIPKMRELVEELDLGCDSATKEKLINHLASQYDNKEAPRRAIQKLLDASS